MASAERKPIIGVWEVWDFALLSTIFDNVGLGVSQVGEGGSSNPTYPPWMHRCTDNKCIAPTAVK